MRVIKPGEGQTIIQRTVAALRFSQEPSAIAFLATHDSLSPSDCRDVPIEALCIKAQVSPAAILGATFLAIRDLNRIEAAMTAAVEHPEVLRQTIHFAKTVPGASKDREMIHSAVGFLPTGDGNNFTLNLVNGVPQRDKPEEEESDDEQSFNAAFPALNAHLEDWSDRRRKLLTPGDSK